MLVLVALVACSDAPAPTEVWTPADHAQPPRQEVDPSRIPRQQQPERRAEPTGQERVEAAATLWRLSCTGCHGAEGHGDGPNAPGPMADLSSAEWQASVSNEDIARVITLGEGAMPAFGQLVAPAGIVALVEHVRRLGAGSEGATDGAPEAGGAEAAPASPAGTAPAGGAPGPASP